MKVFAFTLDEFRAMTDKVIGRVVPTCPECVEIFARAVWQASVYGKMIDPMYEEIPESEKI